MKNKDIDIDYYENNDLSDMLEKNWDKKKIYKGKTKRITINIPLSAYEEAHLLDQKIGMGYQNVLKAAMALGLLRLHEQLGKSLLRSRKKTKTLL